MAVQKPITVTPNALLLRVQARKGLPGKIGNRLSQPKRSIERLGALQPYTQFAGFLAKETVHVKENFHMIA